MRGRRVRTCADICFIDASSLSASQKLVKFYSEAHSGSKIEDPCEGYMTFLKRNL
jgi:hypothetical protein